MAPERSDTGELAHGFFFIFVVLSALFCLPAGITYVEPGPERTVSVILGNWLMVYVLLGLALPSAFSLFNAGDRVRNRTYGVLALIWLPITGTLVVLKMIL